MSQKKVQTKSQCVVAQSNVEALVCASCPEAHQDTVTEICRRMGIQKAYGRTGDMVDTLRGNDWVGKWQAKVVMAVVTKAQTLNSKSCKIICIQGGRHCDQELSHQPLLLKAIKLEMNDKDFRVRVEWLDIEDFLQSYGDQSTVSLKGSNTKPSASRTNPAGVNVVSQAQSKIRKVNGMDQTRESAPNNNKVNNKVSPSVPPAQQPTGNQKKASSSDRNNVRVCGECGVEFPSENAWLKHQKTAGHCDWKCVGCGKEFANHTSFNQHCEATNHNMTRIQQKMVKAQLIKIDNESFVCGECEGSFPTETAWVKHQKATGHRDPTCSVCEKAFFNAQGLAQHCEATGHRQQQQQRNKQGKQPPPNSTQQSGTRKTTTAKEQQNDGGYACGECERMFTTEAACEQHQTATGHEDPCCATCGKVFYSKQSHKQHCDSTGHSDFLYCYDNYNANDLYLDVYGGLIHRDHPDFRQHMVESAILQKMQSQMFDGFAKIRVQNEADSKMREAMVQAQAQQQQQREKERLFVGEILTDVALEALRKGDQYFPNPTRLQISERMLRDISVHELKIVFMDYVDFPIGLPLPEYFNAVRKCPKVQMVA